MRWLAALSMVSAWCGCATPPTQLVVVVDTNLDVPVEIDAVEVSVTGPDGIRTVTPQSLVGPDAPPFPLTLGVAPEGDTLGPIAVAAIGRLAGVEVVRAGATGITLLPGESRVLHLVLVRACVGRECPAGQTCGLEACAPAAVDAADLPAWTGAPPPFDDADPCLAVRWDADGDGQGDVACGGTDCDDAVAAVFEGAPESCNDVDDDCDGAADEDCECAPLDAMENCTTTCGTTGTRRCQPTGWSACAPPAEACDAVDQDCDGLVDEGFAYVPSAPVNLSANAATGDRSNEPDIVWTGDRFGVAWDDQEIGDGTVLATFDEAGVRMTDPVLVGPGRTVALAFGGGVFAVATWWLEGTAGHHVDVRMVRPDGTFASDPVRVVNVAADDPRPAVIWDGEAFVVSCDDQGTITFQRLGPDGTPVSPLLTVPAARSERPDLAFDGTRLTFAWAVSGSVYASQGSELLGFPTEAQLVATVPGVESASAAWLGGTDDLFAWRRGGAAPSIEVAHVDLAAPMTAMPVVLSPTRAPRGAGTPNTIFADIAPGGAQALVTWADARDGDAAPHAARVARDGTVLQGATRLVPPMSASRGEPIRASWTGAAWGVVWEEAETGVGLSDIHYTRLACP